MSTVSDALGAHAEPVRFEHAGRVYAVTPITQAVKSRVERWLRKKAYDDLYALRGDLPADQYRDALAALTADRAQYAYMGEVFQRSIQTAEGVIGLCAILFGTGEDDAARLLAERGEDVTALMLETMISSLPRAAAERVRERMRAAAAGGEPANPTRPA